MNTFVLIATLTMGGVGGWDDLSIDSASHRLFVSHSDRVVVIDTVKKKVVKEIPDTPGVHGIALAPGLGKAFSSNGKEGKVSVIDLTTLSTKGKIPVGENPDAILFEPKTKEVYVFNGKSHSASVIDAASEKVVATIPLSGKPEFAAADPEDGRVFVNIADKNEVAAIDTAKHAVAATWALAGCDSPSGIAIDRTSHRVFSACENHKMVMSDARKRLVLASVETGEGADGAGFDPVLGLAFTSNGKSGNVTVVRPEAAKLVVVQQLKTQTGARTMTVDPETHRIYLPTADFQPAEAGKRPKVVDGTQRVLILEAADQVQ
jgi:YVTN family beta-propeller protein